MINNIVEILFENAEKHPNKLAIIRIKAYNINEGGST